MTSGKIFAALTGAAVVAATLMVSAQVPADAQVVRIPQAAPDQVLPAYEVVTILRSTGLDPIGAPMRHGVTYRFRAFDRAGRDLNVVVDARYGDILLVEPAGAPFPERRRMVGIPPDYDDPTLYDRPPEMYSNTPPYPPRAIKPAPAPHVATVPADKRPPIPRPRPEAVAAQSAPAAPSATPPAPKAETAPAQESGQAAPTKWKDEPAPTNAPAAAAPTAPKVPDVAPLE